ncbi:MAG: hypothetical protein R3C42_08570 [Parvularculaceae bacterium]|nr:hypothetical protein [Parvularculaceae bacterium]
MAFNSNDGATGDSGRKAKRSPLAGLFGLAARQQDELDLPAMDVAAGLDRALRRTAGAGEARKKSAAGPAGKPDNVRETLAAIESALFSIDAIRDIIEQAYEVALSANDSEEAGARALLAESFDELRLSINNTVETVDERAAMLIGRSQRQIDVKLGGKAHYSVSPCRLDVTQKGLNINPPRDAFSSYEEIAATIDELDGALKKADRVANAYCRDAQFLIAKLHEKTQAA